MILDDGEVWRIKRARVALLLHVMPAAVDDMPGEDVEDVLAIHAAEAEIEAWHHQRQSKRMNRRR